MYLLVLGLLHKSATKDPGQHLSFVRCAIHWVTGPPNIFVSSSLISNHSYIADDLK